MVRKKILFVISALGGGGAERVLVLILKHLERAYWNPAVVIFEDRNDYRHEWPPDVPVWCLNKTSRWDCFRLAWQLAQLIRRARPALVVPLLTYTNYLTAAACRLARNETPLLLCEHSTLEHSLKPQKLSRLKEELVRCLYPGATGIIAVSKEIKRDLEANYNIPGHRCTVIYNPVETDRVRALAAEEVQHLWFAADVPVIAACGRLTTVKNYPLMLRAVRLVLRELPVRLVILGKGEFQAELESYARELDISSNVDFLGFQENPFKYIARARAYALSSSWEGLPMVLLEAMACGTPVVSTRCPSGPEEIITDGVNGLLVPVGDERALADAILRVLRDEPLRGRLAEAGRRRAEDFRMEKIMAEYERVFRECAAT